MTPLLAHRRAPLLRIPSAANLNCCAEGKCSSSLRHQGKATARQLGMMFACSETRMISNGSLEYLVMPSPW